MSIKYQPGANTLEQSFLTALFRQLQRTSGYNLIVQKHKPLIYRDEWDQGDGDQ